MVIVGRGVAGWLQVPEAVVLVVLAVLASLIPEVPDVSLPPDVVLLVFVPPLICNAAFLSAPRVTKAGLAFRAELLRAAGQARRTVPRPQGHRRHPAPDRQHLDMQEPRPFH